MSLLNPRVDFAFKKLFGSEENKAILISFINAVVSKDNQITEVILLNPYNHKEHTSDKLSILDIKAKDEQGRQYNIEMQITDQVFYNQRALYYWSKLYSNQLQQGDGFSELKKTISINVLNFNYFDDEPEYHNVFKLLNLKSHRCYTEDLELHFIELAKFDQDISHIKTALERWVAFLLKAGYYESTNLPPELTVDPAIEQAANSLNLLSLDKEERDIYEARLKWLRDEDATLQKAVIRGSDLEKRKLVKKSFQKGLDEALIAEITGLSIDTVRTIKNTKQESL